MRAKALTGLLVEKGVVTQEAIDRIVDTLEHRVGPHLGAKLVARAWVDPAFKQQLLADGSLLTAVESAVGALE